MSKEMLEKLEKASRINKENLAKVEKALISTKNKIESLKHEKEAYVVMDAHLQEAIDNIQKQNKQESLTEKKLIGVKNGN